MVGEEFRFCSAVVLTVSLRRLSCKVQDFFLHLLYNSRTQKKRHFWGNILHTALFNFFGKGKIGDVYSLIPSGVQVTCQERFFSEEEGGCGPFLFPPLASVFFQHIKRGKFVLKELLYQEEVNDASWKRQSLHFQWWCCIVCRRKCTVSECDCFVWKRSAENDPEPRNEFSIFS